MKIIIALSNKNIEDINDVINGAYEMIDEEVDQNSFVQKETSWEKKFGFGSVQKEEQVITIDVLDGFITKTAGLIKEYYGLVAHAIKVFLGDKMKSFMEDFEEIETEEPEKEEVELIRPIIFEEDTNE